jgi:hypothetical protein
MSYKTGTEFTTAVRQKFPQLETGSISITRILALFEEIGRKKDRVASNRAWAVERKRRGIDRAA